MWVKYNIWEWYKTAAHQSFSDVIEYFALNKEKVSFDLSVTTQRQIEAAYTKPLF